MEGRPSIRGGAPFHACQIGRPHDEVFAPSGARLATLPPVRAPDASAGERRGMAHTSRALIRATSNALQFGLSHRTRLRFDSVEREGNCVEYAELFASIVNREHGSEDVRAWVVRSDAEILGETANSPAWKDHDWVLVVARTCAGTRRLYVDPTLYDMGLGWDISRAVLGAVQSP
jgi:hypothetical protein